MTMQQAQTPEQRPLYLPVVIMCAGVLLAAFGATGLLSAAFHAFTPKLSWFVTVAGIAITGLGWSGLKGSWSFGALFTALFLGGAAQLWMTEPLWFPALRFRPDDTLDLIMIGLIGLQGLTSLFFLLKTGAMAAVGRFTQTFGSIRIIVFLGLAGMFAVSPLGYLSYGGIIAYITHLIAGAAMIVLNLMTVAALLRVRGPGLGSSTFHPLVPALFALIVSSALAWLAFERLPHVEDEVAFLFQARTFAGGGLTVPAPPEAAIPGLEHYLLDIRDGRWFATTPPGWTALLAVGVLLGAPWIINPLLAFGSVLLAHNITLRIAGDTTAKLVALLMAASPWLLGTAASLMPHMITLFLTLFAWWALLHSRSAGTRILLWSVLAGVAMGWIFATRQLEGLILGSLTGLWLLTLIRERGGMPRVALYGMGCLFAGGMYLWFNYAMTGDLLLDPLKRYLNDSWGQGANGYGFGPEIGPPGGWGALDLSPGHSVYEGLVNLVNNMSALSIEYLGWGTGSLALFWVYILYARPTKFELALMAISALVIAALFLYWFSGSFYIGPRYWFSAFFPLLVLSAKGFFLLQERLAKLDITAETSGAVLIVLCLFGTSVFTTWRGVEKYHEYGNFHTFPRDAKAGGELGSAIVFFDTETVDYGSAFAENDPWMDPDQPLFIRDLGAEINTEVINAMPGRSVTYLKNGD